MGLDMHLEARRFLWIFDDGKDADVGKAIREALPEIGDMRPQGVTVEAMYWRKANAIHQWFVDNVQDGTDDCDHYHVDRENLEELRDLCQQVLDDQDRAAELLPTHTQSGFFFGGNDYDEWYWDNVRYTRDTLAKLLANEQLKGWDFYYHSSW